VYVGLTEPGGAAVARHYGIVLREVSARTETPPNEARLKLIDVTWTRQPNSVPVPQVREFFTRELTPCPERVPPWRTLIVDVSPEALRFGWKPDPNGPEEPLAALVRTESGKFLLPHTAQPNRPASTRDVPPGGARACPSVCARCPPRSRSRTSASPPTRERFVWLFRSKSSPPPRGPNSR